ncbi:PITH domain-containing protein GA19395 [Sitodiplosis mosellana]|uniref:PITH domain-containing protein GA19395 n=1 Tax=Sitodiplosis mosellana TaxID=263140 RepID=UPI0024442372|nr:PITH domain-containing protein GA19395 [Sitodiplosis mosellana]
MPDDHHHNEGGCVHESADSDYLKEIGIQYSLYTKIDMENLECLNESTDGSGKLVFKSYENRLNFDKFVESDADEELLFNIPFTGNIKIKGLTIIGANDNSHPKKVRLFKNRPKMSFDDASSKADEEFDLTHNPTGELEYPIKPVQFSSVHHLTLHFPSNFGEDKTRIYYIGLRGEFSPAHYHGVTICNYESAPNVSDHKNNVFDSVTHRIQ